MSLKDSVDEDPRSLVGHLRTTFVALKRGDPMPSPFGAVFESRHLGMRQVQVLMSVALARELSVSDLADMLKSSLSATSLMVGELSRAGLLERTEDERDRQRTIVRVADECREGTTAWVDQRMEPLRRTLERLSPRARSFLKGWRILYEEAARSSESTPSYATNGAAE